jgi:hypothetical protein
MYVGFQGSVVESATTSFGYMGLSLFEFGVVRTSVTWEIWSYWNFKSLAYQSLTMFYKFHDSIFFVLFAVFVWLFCILVCLTLYSFNLDCLSCMLMPIVRLFKVLFTVFFHYFMATP